MASSPVKICQVDVFEIITLRAEFDQSVHLLQTLQAVYQIAVGTQLAQMAKTLQF